MMTAPKQGKPESTENVSLEVPESRKDMTLAEATAYIDKVMDCFQALEDMVDLHTMYEVGKSLSRSYFNCVSHRKEMSEQLVSHEYPLFCTKVMKKLNNLGVFKNDDIWFSSFYFYNVAWNFSDCSSVFATSLATSGLPNLLNLNIGHQPYLENLNSKNVYYLMKASLSIMHNIARVPGNTHYFSEDGVKQSLLDLAQREEEFLKCVATLTLAYTINENETHLLEKGADSIGKLISYIDNALKVEKRRYHGFSIDELLAALVALSVNDSIKKEVVTHEGVTLLKRIITAHEKGETTELEVELSCKIIWNLAFDPLINTSLKGEYKIIQVLEPLKNHPNKGVQKAAEGAMWMLTKNDNKVEHALAEERVQSAGAYRRAPGSAEKAKKKEQVFISYCWSNKELVFKIREWLRKENIPVWIDVESMKGSTLDAMAEGIEQSDAVVMCMSEAYKKSPNCRTEAEYAFKLHKPILPVILQYKYKPDGWLGMILGVKLYYDVSGVKRSFETSVGQLVENLLEILRPGTQAAADSGKDDADSVTAIGVENHADSTDRHVNNNNNLDIELIESETSGRLGAEKASTNHVSSRGGGSQKAVVRREVLKWSSQDVQRWLRDNKISTVAMHEVDGQLLAQLVRMRRDAPEFFFNCLQGSLKFTFADILRFSDALQKLGP